MVLTTRRTAVSLVVLAVAGGTCAIVAAGAARPAPAVPRSVEAVADAQPERFDARGSLPVVAEHRYRMAGKIRALLLFWMGKDNVGGARVRWRRGEGDARGYDLLIGSDPDRAPRRINRWGFILEETRGAEAMTVGVMKRSDEESLDEARAHVSNEAQTGIFFKMIQARATATESVASVTTTRVPRDYSYRDLAPLMDALERTPADPRVKRIAMAAGIRPGFLIALADLLHDTAEHVAGTGRAPGRKAIPYAYNGKLYELSRTSSEVLHNATFGTTTYPRLVQAWFETGERGATSRDAFMIACGVEGPLKEIPVFVSYQPKWWFKADMVLDEREKF